MSAAVHASPPSTPRPSVLPVEQEGKLEGKKVTIISSFTDSAWKEKAYKMGAVLGVFMAACATTAAVSFTILGAAALTSGMGAPIGVGLLLGAGVAAFAIFPSMIFAGYCMSRAKHEREERLEKNINLA